MNKLTSKKRHELLDQLNEISYNIIPTKMNKEIDK